jgi:hypothetical protein
MKFTSKRVNTLELDEHEHETFMETLAIVANGETPDDFLMKAARRLQEDINNEISRFISMEDAP